MLLFILPFILTIHVEVNGEIVETFLRGGDAGIEFFIVGERVPWSRAKLLCSNFDNELDINSKSRLASLEDESTRKWLAKMLSESDNRYDELWVDGRKDSYNSNWTWTEKNITIENSVILENKPKWYKGNQETQNNCLTFGRLGHDLPVLVSSNCQRGKPFLCVRTQKEKVKIVEGTSVFADGYNYTLYGIGGKASDEEKFAATGVGKINGGGVKWRNARLECRKRGQHLAMILSNEAAMTIANAMLRSRPSVENAWLGGRSEDGISWVWSGTDKSLPAKKSPITEYPPWLANHPRPVLNSDEFSEQKPTCLMLDRHLCPENVSPVFLDVDCEKERPFICQHDVPEINLHNDIARSITQIDSYLEFSIERMSWSEGRDYCKKKNGRIATVFDSETLFTVLQKMTELHLEHIWIGGKTEATSDPNVWKWMDEDGRELSKNHLGGAISWCLGNDQNSFFKPEPNFCLNLDREAHGLPLFYGLPCESTRQRIICRIPIEKLEASSTSTSSSDIDNTELPDNEANNNKEKKIEEAEEGGDS